ncbi:MAG: histidine--tRNA ligase [Desulfovibrio sp.]|nr:histidine--tRNA ligase [Desulfovibrio sp.]
MRGAITKLKGFADLYGPELAIFKTQEVTAREIFARYGYDELRPPLLESTSLFQRGIGQETDVVQKEMFTFQDSKGRSMSLRPEATAGVLRAAIEAGLAKPDQITRLFTIGPMFRHERPQKGRMRQFHQINAECLGSDSPYADADLIAMLLHFLDALGIHDLNLKINSLGCGSCRPKYLAELRRFLDAQPEDSLCDDCKRRRQSNPLRVLDCKICTEQIAEAPRLREFLCEDCSRHFETVLALLNESGICYELEDRLVRGLDYYMRTTFEVVSGRIGSQTAVAGGGRYDGLVEELGGVKAPGAGFACGMERLALLMQAPEVSKPDFFILGLAEPCREAGFLLAGKLRAQGYSGLLNYASGSMKSLMRQVSRSRARYCLILGPEELAGGKIAVRNMETGEQVESSLECVAEFLKS